MSGSRDGAQLRAALSRYREQKRYGKYPSELQERAMAYAQERARTGASATEIAEELGVHQATADRWTCGHERSTESYVSSPKMAQSLPFLPVVVRPEPRDVPPVQFELAFPDGTRMQVSGLAGRDITEAIEALRRTR